MERPIYLDYNATTPIAQEVAEAIQPCLGPLFGNPSSPHIYGIEAKQAVERARQQVAQFLGCATSEVVFTSGGTEANNMALKGVAEANAARGRHIITTAVEHPAILEPCEALARAGWEITVLPVDDDGRVDPVAVERALRPDTILVSVMHANNEVGTIQPIAEIAALAHAHGALVHTDAAQTPGKLPVSVQALGVDLLSLAGHKLYAPKGVGALYVRQGTPLAKFLHGAGHESNRRASTENLIGIVGLGAACELAGQNLEAHAGRMAALRDHLEAGLLRVAGDVRINGHRAQRLPNTTSASFRGLNASDLLVELSDTLAVSAGAACHSNQVDVSSVLQAMRVPFDYARGTLRFSLGRHTTEEEIDRAIEVVGAAVAALRAEAKAQPPN
ncbi:MAG: cysteine desulfurase family protein [Anaerolineae bacterium]